MYSSNVIEFLMKIQEMAAALQNPRALNKRTIFSDFIKLVDLITTDNLELIRDFFEDLSPEHVNMLINSTVNDESLLFTAASLGKLDICTYLLRLSLRQGREQMCNIWKTQRHPLTAAITANNEQVIELIAHNLYDINDTVTVFHTPLILAALSNKLWLIKMVLQLGADVNLSCGNPLTSAFLSRDSARFLVEQGAEIDQQDENGETALHSAVKDNQVRTVKYLVEAGANVCIRCQKGYTPLILAALQMSRPILDYLTEHSSYSLIDRIETLEIFDACRVLSGQADIDYWLSTLEMRKYNNPKQITVPDQAVFELAVEFSTQQELFHIRDNQLLLAYQGVLVIERIFGVSDIYVKSIVQTAIIAKREGKLEKVREVIDYIQTICQRQNLHSFINDERESMQELFAEIVSDGRPDDCFLNGAFNLFQVVSKAASKRWSLIKSHYIGSKFVLDGGFINIIDTFLYMADTFYTLNLSAENLKESFAVLKELVKDNPRVYCQQTLLHRALTTDNDHDCCLELIQVLIEAGVDVNSKDYFRQTPLIYAVKHPSNSNYEIIECLLKHGAHLDCQSSEGFYATDFSCWKTLPNLPRDSIALSCQAVRVILDNNLPYETTLPKIIRDFVDLHK